MRHVSSNPYQSPLLNAEEWKQSGASHGAAGRRGDHDASAPVSNVRLRGRDFTSQGKRKRSSMPPFLARPFGRTLWRAPSSRTIYQFGLGPGLISSLLWTVLGLIVPYGIPTPYLMLTIIASAIDFAPLALIAAAGFWIGRREGSVLHGVFAGIIAGGVGAGAYLVLDEIFLLRTSIGEGQAWHTNAPLVLLLLAFLNLIASLILAVIGAIVGGIGALVGRRWHQRGQPEWHESVSLIVSRVDDAELTESITESTAPRLVTFELD